MFGRKKNTGAPPVPSPHFQAARQVRLTELDTTAAQHNLDKADAGGHISLVKNAQAVGEQLQKRGLLGRQAEPWLLIDRSGSMAGHYRSGAVQQLVERALAFALLVSPTGTVNVVGFGSGLTKVVRVTQANYQGVIGRDIPHPGWDTTNLTAALDVVLRRAETADLPIYCVVVADGGADDPATATARFCKSSQYAIFVKLLAVIPVPWTHLIRDTSRTGTRTPHPSRVRRPAVSATADPGKPPCRNSPQTVRTTPPCHHSPPPTPNVTPASGASPTSRPGSTCTRPTTFPTRPWSPPRRPGCHRSARTPGARRPPSPRHR
jgi:hypothetical protein